MSFRVGIYLLLSESHLKKVLYEALAFLLGSSLAGLGSGGVKHDKWLLPTHYINMTANKGHVTQNVDFH